MSGIFIIAEAGVNHNGSLETAKRLVDAARKCGADAVKFQTARLESLVSIHAPMAKYQKENTGVEQTQREMLKKLLLTYDEFEELAAYCGSVGIEFLSSPFDIESVRFLNRLVRLWKVPSGEITNLPYLIEIARTGKDVFLSTGMCCMDEVEAAVNVLRSHGSGQITLLQCNTEYPTPYEDANLRAMETMRVEFKVPVGYSDHTLGTEVPIAAAALGAAVIEKHFTLDRNMRGPDHKASLEPREFGEMIRQIQNVEAALGSGKKEPSPSESKNINVARKSIVAGQFIKKGDMFSEKNLAAKRPGGGISPMMWNDVVGKKAGRDFCEDEMIEI